ncbi:uncharacterized protein METZ01_LOCUS380272 [marine metagenome]|uniref:Uncharacterized protein n=1 Tax=marine metagenome TaxID=408172 RepID=A0A382U185_9ZZZZ
MKISFLPLLLSLICLAISSCMTAEAPTNDPTDPANPSSPLNPSKQTPNLPDYRPIKNP